MNLEDEKRIIKQALHTENEHYDMISQEDWFALLDDGLDEFVETYTQNIPEAQDHFVRMNRLLMDNYDAWFQEDWFDFVSVFYFRLRACRSLWMSIRARE